MTSLLDPHEDEPARLGPVDHGQVHFTLEGRAWAVDVPADGRRVCAWAREGNWPRLVPWSLADWCRDDFVELLADPVGRVDLAVCHRVVVELAEDIYGVPWWTAGRIAASITQFWDRYAAWSVLRGFDPAGASAQRITASGLAWLRSAVSEERDAEKLEATLFTPPRPKRKKAAHMPGFSAADQAASFQAAFAALGGGSG